jgi:hypothetical protein
VSTKMSFLNPVFRLAAFMAPLLWSCGEVMGKVFFIGTPGTGDCLINQGVYVKGQAICRKRLDK